MWEEVQGEETGLVVELTADHFSLQHVQSLQDFPGRLVNTSRLYHIARLFFRLERLAWKGCYFTTLDTI